MAPKNETSKVRILSAAAAQLLQMGADRVTLDSVASAAGCAKGLVHYHFRSKAKLVASALEKVLEDRDRRWSALQQDANAENWIHRTWDLVAQDASVGVPRALNSAILQGDELTVQTAKSGLRSFREALAVGLTWFLTSQGLRSSLPIEELSGLAAAAMLGMTMELSAGVAAAEVEAEYAALWLGLLSATRAERR